MEEVGLVVTEQGDHAHLQMVVEPGWMYCEMAVVTGTQSDK